MFFLNGTIPQFPNVGHMSKLEAISLKGAKDIVLTCRGAILSTLDVMGLEMKKKSLRFILHKT